MSLEESTREIWARVTSELVKSGITVPMGNFVAAAGASVIALATEIDRLRGDLVANGIEISL